MIGAHKHLLFDDQTKSGSWTEDADLQVPIYTKSFKNKACFDTLLKLAASQATLEFPAEYANLARFAFNSQAPMWSMLLPKHVFRSTVMNFVNAAIEANTETVMQYYSDVWERVGHFLNGLKPIKISGADAGTVVYDRLSTRTGRMIVVSGPKILTMSKEDRKFISGESNAPIYYVDFRALEPTIVANVMGSKFSGSDLYAWLAENVMSVASRDAAKKAVVSSLYGDQMNRSADARSIAEWFDLKNLACHIRAASPDKARIINIYGRMISTKDIENDGYIINDYIQSSAVDAAVLGFEQICSSLRLSPLGVIHDAIIVEDCYNALEEGFVSSTVVDRVGKLYYKATRLSA